MSFILKLHFHINPFLKFVFFSVRCPDGWKRNGDYCFLFKKEKKTQLDASKFCGSKGSNLASIRDKQENDFIMSEYLH